MSQTIYIASDHAGFELKKELVAFLRNTFEFQVIDCGAEIFDENDDYTDFISRAAQAVSDNPEHNKAIIMGGSGQGEAMLANRFSNVRAVVYYGFDEEIIRLSRVHNDANILSLGARFIGIEEAKKAVTLWLTTEHIPVERYDRRIAQSELSAPTDISSLQSDTLVRSIVPSLPASSFEQLETWAAQLKTVAKELQIDIVDGVFAPHVSWPFTELDVETEFFKLRTLSESFQVEVDCMCMHPERYLAILISLEVTRIVIHEGSTSNYDQIIEHLHEAECKVGLAVTNGTSFEVLSRYAQELDFVQVMGIENIGMQGQPFDAQTLKTIAHIRGLYPELEIAVDGGVNAQTIPALLRAGANRFAPGSALSKASDPTSSYEQLASLVGV